MCRFEDLCVPFQCTPSKARELLKIFMHASCFTMQLLFTYVCLWRCLGRWLNWGFPYKPCLLIAFYLVHTTVPFHLFCTVWDGAPSIYCTGLSQSVRTLILFEVNLERFYEQKHFVKIWHSVQLPKDADLLKTSCRGIHACDTPTIVNVF